MELATPKFTRSITLHKNKVDAHGKPSHWYVLPSQNMRDIIIRQLLKLDKRLNYVLTWKDTNGYGLQVTQCAWVQPGSVHYA